MSCATPSCCLRHPRFCARHSANASANAATGGPAVKSPPSQPAVLLLSVPLAAYVPVWYARAAVSNWLDFTLPSTSVVIHMDRARAENFSDALPLSADWHWLRKRGVAERVLVNPMRLHTYRRSGSLLAAHLHNVLFAQRVLSGSAQPPSHILFLASNCFFFRRGVEVFVSSRGASAAIRACPEAPIRATRHHCTTQPWFAELNGHRTTARRLLIEGQFYPLAFATDVARSLQGRDDKGRPPPGTSATSAPMPSLFHLLERSVACTAEENVLPALVLRARSAAHVGVVGPPTEPVAWIPKSLANGSVVSSATVRWLLGSLHTPQSLCHRASGGGGAATTVAAGGCTACPDPGKWPQTKFIVGSPTTLATRAACGASSTASR